jgi:2-polyprenyl-3-methyl-5-hydroxy-6-metoxy-1,4-benzoquinol methylase
MQALESMYAHHHSENRGDGFVLMGDERGAFLKDHTGKGKRVLDIGCRDGALTSSFIEGNTVTGIDIDSSALQRASALGIKTQQVDLNGEWRISPNSFDVVVAAEVLEHLYYPRLVMEKIQNVLKKEGTLLGSVPNAFSIKNRLRYMCMQKKGTPLEDPTHINHFIVAELHALLSEFFEEVHIYGIGRFKRLIHISPQLFAFDLMFEAKYPKK